MKGDTLEDIICDLWENCGRKKGDIATDMGVPLSTLSRETSLYDTGAKFGAASLVPFMKATGSMKPLEFIAAAMGHKLTPVNAEPESWEMPKEIIEGYEAVATYLKASNDPDIHHIDLFALRSLAEKQLDDVFKVARKRDYERKK